MKNFRNIFKEYQGDPKTFRDLKIGFACLIVLGILIAFVVSPPLRHSIGIGDNHPVINPPAKVIQHNKHAKTPGKEEGRLHNKQSNQGSHAHGHSHPSTTHPSPNQVEGSEGVKTPHETPGGGGGHPAPESSPPGTPTPSHPTENNPPPSGGGGGGESGGGSPPGSSGGHVGVEVEVPGVTLPPVVEEVTKGLNETVNGLTSIVNEVTKEAPVQVEVPPICILKC